MRCSPSPTPGAVTPAEMLLGLFASPADAALMDEVTAIAYEGRRNASTRDIGIELPPLAAERKP